MSNSNGWRKARFGDVVRNVNVTVGDPIAGGVQKTVGLDDLDSGSLTLRRFGDPTAGTTFTKHFLAGQVLFGKRRAYQRKVAVPDFEGVCSGDILVFEAMPERLLPELLPFIAQSEPFYDRALRTSRGSLSPRTSWKDLAEFELWLAPLNEQRRIAELLWALESARDANSSLKRSLSVLYQANVDAFMDRPNSRREPLGEVADIAYGITLNARRDLMGSKLPYLRVANVSRGFIDLSEVKHVGCTPEEAQRFRLVPSDVLIVEGHADRRQVGRAAMWQSPDSSAQWIHQNHLLRVRCSDQILPDCVLAAVNSTPGQAYFRAQSKSTSGLSTINSTVLRAFEVPVPDLPEQRQFSQLLEKLAIATERVALNTDALTSLLRTSTSRLLAPEGAGL